MLYGVYASHHNSMSIVAAAAATATCGVLYAAAAASRFSAGMLVYCDSMVRNSSPVMVSFSIRDSVMRSIASRLSRIWLSATSYAWRGVKGRQCKASLLQGFIRSCM